MRKSQRDVLIEVGTCLNRASPGRPNHGERVSLGLSLGLSREDFTAEAAI